MQIQFKNLPEIFQFDLPDGLAMNLTITSYTAANVAQGTILSTITHLGQFNEAQIDLGHWQEVLSAFSQDAPNFEFANKLAAAGAEPQFWLDIELVAVRPPYLANAGFNAFI